MPSAGGGASGSATLETLMDRMPFRPKPKIVDLTSERKLADKARSLLTFAAPLLSSNHAPF